MIRWTHIACYPLHYDSQGFVCGLGVQFGTLQRSGLYGVYIQRVALASGCIIFKGRAT
jgi:hypothetical protein